MIFFRRKKTIERFGQYFIKPDDLYVSDKILKTSQSRLNVAGKRPSLFLCAAFIAIAFLIYQTFVFAIIQNRESLNSAASIQQKIIYTPSARGIIFDKNGKVLATNKLSYEIFAIPTLLPKDSNSLNDWIVKSAEALAIDAKVIKENLSSQNLFLIKRVLLLETDDIVRAELIKEKIKNLTGIEIVQVYKRIYPYAPYGSHILGYVAKKNEFAKAGKDGIEMIKDSWLEGKVGMEIFRIDAHGNIIAKIDKTPSLDGMDIYLTIDIEVQKKLEDIFERYLRTQNKEKGAAVILDPRDGSVVALASFPRFDNNNIVKYLNDATEPLFNRAISGQYPSGSVIKPAVALAALNENIIAPEKNIFVTGSISVQSELNPDVKYIFRDWKAHGYVDMRRAIAVSSNVYFYTIGGGFGDINGLGIEKLARYLKTFNFGSKTGIDLPGESHGLVPAPEWKKQTKKEAWYIGDTYNLSIGQGDLKATPLQVAFLNLLIANRGNMYMPHILKSECLAGSAACKPQNTLNFKKSDFDIVRSGMRMAVSDGSAKSLADLPFKVGAKTGTAQVSLKDDPHSWFSAFAPYDNPEVAAAVIVENGGEGTNLAMLIMKDFLSWYFSR